MHTEGGALGHGSAPLTSDLVAPPLSAISLNSLSVSFHSCFDICSLTVRVGNEARQACPCWLKRTGQRERVCGVCEAQPLDGFSSGVFTQDSIALAYRLFDGSNPEVTLGVAISLYEEEWDFQKLSQAVQDIHHSGDGAVEGPTLAALDQPVDMVRNYANRSVAPLGRVSLTHDGLYLSDARASTDGTHAIVRVSGWSNRLIDGYLVLQHPTTIASYHHDDCSRDRTSGIILLDSRLSGGFEREVTVLTGQDSRYLQGTLDWSVSQADQPTSATFAALLNATVCSLRLREKQEWPPLFADDAESPELSDQVMEAISWMIDPRRRRGYIFPGTPFGLTADIDSLSRAALLWRRGHFTPAMRIIGRRPLRLDVVRGRRPPAPLMSKNACDACGARKRLGYTVCTGCERDFLKPARGPYDYLPSNIRARVERQADPEYLTAS